MRTFVVLAEELHFGRAAHRLGTAQPAVSKTLKDIEAEIGTRLLDRSNRKVALTSGGRAFLASARQALHHADIAVRSARAGLQNGVERLRLGLSIGAAQPCVGELVARFKAANPIAEMTIAEVDELTLASKLAMGEIDAAIAWDASVPPGLHTRPVFTVPMAVLVAHDHPLATRDAIGTADLEGVPVIVPARDRQPVLQESYRAYMLAHGFEPTIAVDVATTADMLAMVAGGVGVGHAPVPDGIAYPGVRVIAYRPAFEQRYDLVWATETPALSALRECMVDDGAFDR